MNEIGLPAQKMTCIDFLVDRNKFEVLLQFWLSGFYFSELW